MNARPTDWSPLSLSRDPIPGDPAVVRQAERKYRATAEAVNDAATNLARLDMSSNVSIRLAKVLDQIKSVRQQLEQVESRVAGAALALGQYAPALEQAQTDSVAALEDAEMALAGGHRDADIRDQIASDYNNSNDPAVRDHLKDRYDYFNARVGRASASLESARGRVRDAITARDEAARQAIGTLDEIDGSSPVKDTPIEQLLDWLNTHVMPIVNAVAETVSKIATWIYDNIDTIAVVLNLLALVTIWCPPLSGALMAVAKVATLAAWVKDGWNKGILGAYRVMTGQQSMGSWLGDVAWMGASLLISKGAAKAASGALGTVTGKLAGSQSAYAEKVVGRFIEASGESVENIAAKGLEYADGAMQSAGEWLTGPAAPLVKTDSYRRETCSAGAKGAGGGQGW